MANDILIILSVFLTMMLALTWYTKAPARRIKRWRRNLCLDRHWRAFDELYRSVDGFSLSRRERLYRDAPEFVYGEITFESFIALLSACQPQPDTVFYDLGSGTGKAVIAIAMVFDVRLSCGVELFSLLHQSAQQQQNRLLSLPDYRHLDKRILLKQENFLETSLSDATLIFINATTYFADHWRLISKCLEQVNHGTIVISTSKALCSDQFTTVKIVPVIMSWGIVNAFIQRRCNPETNTIFS